MSILTGLVIVVAMATLAQRSDSLLNFFTRETEPQVAPQNDDVAIFAGDSKVIDVLANDENAGPEDGENIRIVVSPSCGAAEATSEGVLYISNDLCVGPQLFAYCVQQGEECPSASVTVMVADPAPGAVRVASQREEAPTPDLSPRRAPDVETPAVETPVVEAPALAPASPPDDARESETAAAPPQGQADDTPEETRTAVDRPAERDSAPRMPAGDASVAALPRTPALETGAPDTAAASPRITDDSTPPQIAAGPAAGRDRRASDRETAAAGAAQGRDPVVAALRPTAPSGLEIGRLADAPRIRTDDGDVPPPDAEPAAAADPETAPAPAPKPSIATMLSDDSEPDVSFAPAALAARPHFDDDEDIGVAVAGGAERARAPLQVAALPSASRTETDVWERPDVSALEGEPAGPEPEGIKIARLPEPIGGSTADRVRDDVVRTLRAAARRDEDRETALPAPAGGVDEAAPAQSAAPATVETACGPAAMRSVAFAGAASLVEIGDACRAGETFVIEHAGLRFGGRLDGAGAAKMRIPVMSEDGDARLIFADGTSTPLKLEHNWRELRLTLRIAVAWTDPVDLDLHAFEYAAPFNSDGHIWQEHPSGFRLVRRSGGGYLESFPAAVEGGESIEVYTFWANSRARRGVARIALDLASRGDTPQGAYCDDGALAAPEYQVVRSERGELKTTARGRFTPARCGATLDSEARYASGALRDLRID